MSINVNCYKFGVIKKPVKKQKPTQPTDSIPPNNPVPNDSVPSQQPRLRS